MKTHRDGERWPSSLAFWLGLFSFAGIAVFFLWEEHEAHILGALPWLLVLACPIIHVFMHRGHGGGDGHRHDLGNRKERGAR